MVITVIVSMAAMLMPVVAVMFVVAVVLVPALFCLKLSMCVSAMTVLLHCGYILYLHGLPPLAPPSGSNPIIKKVKIG